MNMQSIEISGCVTYWSASATDRERLNNELTRIGMESFHAEERTDASALRLALADYCEANYPRKEGWHIESNERPSVNGFSVLKIEKDGDRVSAVHDFTAKVEDSRVEACHGYAKEYELQQHFDKAKQNLTGAAVGKVLTAICKAMEGRTLRDSGGVYWIPETCFDNWDKVCNVVETCSIEAGKTKVYKIRTAMDENTLRAVKDALTSEVMAEARTLSDELMDGADHRDSFYKRRMEQLSRLHDRVKFFEGELSTSLNTLHDIVSLTEQAYTTASLSSLASVAGL